MDTQTVEAVVLAITAVILLWYTIETRLLRKIQQWPLVVVRSIDTHSLVLTNMGNNTAISIRVFGTIVRMDDVLRGEQTGFSSIRSSNLVPFLQSGHSETVRAERFSRETTKAQMTHTSGEVTLTDPLYILMLRVEFVNIAMTPFFVEQQIRSSTLKILHSVKVGYFRRFWQKFFDRDFIKVQIAANGEAESVHVTSRGQAQLTKPLRP